VTGSTGGVGSVSVALLAGLGYSVSASTGKQDAKNFLKKLGASKVIERKAVNDESGRTILKEVWAGAIDTVGGNTLATVLKACKQGGAVAATGLVESTKLPITVFPFIWRGVSLLGIYASGTPMSLRKEIWSRLAKEWKLEELEHIAVDCKLEQLDHEIDRILVGDQRGRVVIDLQ
jgi:putative YhdH/YhfP family quinone oxidoreductase